MSVPASPGNDGSLAGSSLPGPTHLLAAAALLAFPALVPSPVVAQAAGRDTAFRHADHASLSCGHCHSTAEGHGAVTVTSRADCLSCHHGPLVRRECAACHGAEELGGRRFERSTTFELSMGTTATRPLPFDHAEHQAVACADCHAGRPALGASAVACADCHDEHHRPEAACRSCHGTAPEGSHGRDVHLTCAGSGCHAPSPIAASQRTRETCLACHQDLADHRPGRDCATCHLLPPAHDDGGTGEDRGR